MLLVIRNSLFLLGSLLMACQCMASLQGTEIHFNSACDFKALTMDIIKEQDLNPTFITLNIKLQPAAVTQLTQVSRSHFNQNLTMYINDIKINTATIRAELNTEDIQVYIDKKRAKKIFSRLLASQCKQKSRKNMG